MEVVGSIHNCNMVPECRTGSAADHQTTDEILSTIEKERR